jgi:hypothetical protein
MRVSASPGSHATSSRTLAARSSSYATPASWHQTVAEGAMKTREPF